MTYLALSPALHNPLLYTTGRVQTPTAVVLGLPHADGTCRLFLGQERLVPHGTQFLALRYPGREARLTHAPLRRMSDPVEQILSATLLLEGIDLYLLGHSVGVLVRHAVCQEMRARECCVPSGPVVSSSRSPWGTPESTPIHTWSDAGLCEGLLALGGTPPEVLKDPATREPVLSPLRVDYELLETQTPTEEPIDSPIHEIHGDADTLIGDDVDGWGRPTTSDFRSQTASGGHFYLSDSPTLAIHCLTDPIRSRRTTNHQQHE